MPYDEKLEFQIDKLVPRREEISKKKMFGGLCYLFRGNMAFGIYKNSLIVRTGEKEAKRKLKRKHTKPFDITGKIMKGWVMVEKPGWERDSELKGWLELGCSFARSLPPK